MGKKKKRKASKSKIRVFIALIVFGSVTAALGYNCLNNILKIQAMNREKKHLEKELITLQEEKESLETDILKLEDPDYIAKYVREKYFYSKDGEVILRLDE
jgi:cell division protein DivIC